MENISTSLKWSERKVKATFHPFVFVKPLIFYHVWGKKMESYFKFTTYCDISPCTHVQYNPHTRQLRFKIASSTINCVSTLTGDDKRQRWWYNFLGRTRCPVRSPNKRGNTRNISAAVMGRTCVDRRWSWATSERQSEVTSCTWTQTNQRTRKRPRRQIRKQLILLVTLKVAQF